MCISFQNQKLFLQMLAEKRREKPECISLCQKNILVVVGQLPPVTQLIAKVHVLPTIEEISAERSHSTSDLVRLQNPLD